MSIRFPFSYPLFAQWWRACESRFCPSDSGDLEDRRTAQLILGFALAGGAFAVAYAVFYLCVGHFAGAAVILANSLLFSTFPLWALRRGEVDRAGSIFVLALILMFTVLSLIEGGMRGHAVAWLASLPVCAQLMLRGRPRAFGWSLLAVALVGVFASREWAEEPLPMLYPDRWHDLITLVGYLGLGLFLWVLGFLYEFYRQRAMRQRDEAEARLTRAVKDLERLNLEKDEFLGIAAHDLNNPLNVVYGYAEILNETGGQASEYAGEIMESARRMRDIVRNVLDVNRIESGQYPLNPTPFDFPELVRRVLNDHRKPAEEKELQLISELEEVELVADSDACHQVLDNLISNAVKYARPGGEVRVNVKREEDNVRVEVYNQGDGFTEADLENLFQRFAKLSTRPTGGEASTGLGLSITHKIVQAMGGHIQCESEHGHWARFHLRLPDAEV